MTAPDIEARLRELLAAEALSAWAVRPWAVAEQPANDAWHAGRTIYSKAFGTRVGDLTLLVRSEHARDVAELIVLLVNNAEALRDRLAKAERERDEAVKALKPFSDLGPVFPYDWDENDEEYEVTVRRPDCVQARKTFQALTSPTKGGDCA